MKRKTVDFFKWLWHFRAESGQPVSCNVEPALVRCVRMEDNLAWFWSLFLCPFLCLFFAMAPRWHTLSPLLPVPSLSPGAHFCWVMRAGYETWGSLPLLSVPSLRSPDGKEGPVLPELGFSGWQCPVAPALLNTMAMSARGSLCGSLARTPWTWEWWLCGEKSPGFCSFSSVLVFPLLAQIHLPQGAESQVYAEVWTALYRAVGTLHMHVQLGPGLTGSLTGGLSLVLLPDCLDEEICLL